MRNSFGNCLGMLASRNPLDLHFSYSASLVTESSTDDVTLSECPAQLIYFPDRPPKVGTIYSCLLP